MECTGLFPMLFDCPELGLMSEQGILSSSSIPTCVLVIKSKGLGHICNTDTNDARSCAPTLQAVLFLGAVTAREPRFFIHKHALPLLWGGWHFLALQEAAVCTVCMCLDACMPRGPKGHGTQRQQGSQPHTSHQIVTRAPCHRHSFSFSDCEPVARASLAGHFPSSVSATV